MRRAGAHWQLVRRLRLPAAAPPLPVRGSGSGHRRGACAAFGSLAVTRQCLALATWHGACQCRGRSRTMPASLPSQPKCQRQRLQRLPVPQSDPGPEL